MYATCKIKIYKTKHPNRNVIHLSFYFFVKVYMLICYGGKDITPKGVCVYLSCKTVNIHMLQHHNNKRTLYNYRNKVGLVALGVHSINLLFGEGTTFMSYAGNLGLTYSSAT